MFLQRIFSYLLLLTFTISCTLLQKHPVTNILDTPRKRKIHEAFSKHIMIATQGSAASKAGLKMARLGGNAIDVATAISFAISVERPQSTGLGGGGFMLIHLAKENKTIAVDFREKAPLKAFEKMYLDKKKQC